MNITPRYQRQYVTIDGQRIAYIAAGSPSNPPLVMVHGWISFAGIWSQTIEAFKDTHYCISIDLLGHGFSDKPADGDYSIAANAERVLKVADALGINQFTYLGHSMGGQIGLYMAANAPGRITKMVDVAGVVTGKLSNYILWLHKPIMRMGAIFPSMWNMSRVMSRYQWYSSIFDKPIFYKPSTIPFESEERQMGLVKGIEVPAYRELQAIAAANVTELLHKIDIPVLVIFGKHDGTVPVENGHLAKQHIANSQIVWLDECGHVPMTEKTAEYLAALRTFFAA